MTRIGDAFAQGAASEPDMQTFDRLRLPDSLPDPGLLVGWSLEAEHGRRPVGFGFGEPDKTPATGWIDPILLSAEGHLITIAPTGTGKGRSCIIPSLLRHDGPVIVIDPKGENVAVTARHRREMGQQVIVLDPMKITGGTGDAFNPMDLVDAGSVDAVDFASVFASAMVQTYDDTRNTYWYQRAQQLLISLILHVSTLEDSSERTFETVRIMLARLVAELSEASTFDPRIPRQPRLSDEILNSPHPEARIAASILQSGAREGLGSILSMAQDGIDFLRGDLIREATAASSFDLDAVTRGDPLSIYLVLPPHMMESHGRLLRLWITGLLALITRRRGRPGKSTLLILDEAAQLGSLPQLRQAITLLRGYGVQTWSFWQDASQLRHLYPADWQTMVNNCAVVQTFGALNLMAAREMEGLTGFGGGDGRRMLDLGDHEMILQISGDEAIVARKPDYLTDPAFRGQFDPNPFHDPDQAVVPPPPPRIVLGARPGQEPGPSQPLTPDEEFDAPPQMLIDVVREMKERKSSQSARIERFRKRLERKWLVDDPTR